MFPTLIVLVSTDWWLKYFLTGSGISLFNNFGAFFFQEFFCGFPPTPPPTCVNFQLWQWVLQFKYVLYEEVPLDWFFWVLFLFPPTPPPPPQACYPPIFPSLSIRNITSFPHCPFHCVSYHCKYLSFRLRNLTCSLTGLLPYLCSFLLPFHVSSSFSGPCWQWETRAAHSTHGVDTLGIFTVELCFLFHSLIFF